MNLILLDSAEKLKRNDGLAIRRAIMLRPILTGEENAMLEKERLLEAVCSVEVAVPTPLR